VGPGQSCLVPAKSDITLSTHLQLNRDTKQYDNIYREPSLGREEQATSDRPETRPYVQRRADCAHDTSTHVADRFETILTT